MLSALPSRQRRLLLLALLAAWLTGCASSLKSIATGAADFVDPLASNWEVEEIPLPRDRVLIALSMKRYYAGGAGEARALALRRARELMHLGGFSRFEVVEFSESIDSSQYGAKRKAELLICLVRPDDSSAAGSAHRACGTQDSG